MNYTPTTWKTGDKISSAGLNNIEQGIAALYPQEVVIAPEQTVTITSETDINVGVPITLADGIDPSTLSPSDVYTLNVVINGEPAIRQNNGWIGPTSDGAGDCGVFLRWDENTGLCEGFSIAAAVMSGNTPVVLPGDNTVQITQVATANPMIKAFPVVPYTPGPTEEIARFVSVINAPQNDVNTAMAAGLVLLYPEPFAINNGFAFGVLADDHVSYATINEGSFTWRQASIDVTDGKYAIRNEN